MANQDPVLEFRCYERLLKISTSIGSFMGKPGLCLNGCIFVELIKLTVIDHASSIPCQGSGLVFEWRVNVGCYVSANQCACLIALCIDYGIFLLWSLQWN